MEERPEERVWENKISSCGSLEEPNSPVAFHGKDGPRCAPRGGGPRGGAARRQGEGLWEQRHVHETLSSFSDSHVDVFHAGSVNATARRQV